MRAVLGIIAALLASTEARAECKTVEYVKEWMRLAWWGSTFTEIQAGADTKAISDGYERAAGKRITPEGLYLLFIDKAGERMRVTVFAGQPQVCLVDWFNVRVEDLAVWLERSRS